VKRHHKIHRCIKHLDEKAAFGQLFYFSHRQGLTDFLQSANPSFPGVSRCLIAAWVFQLQTHQKLTVQRRNSSGAEGEPME
jgi:hypothetical protein